MVPEILFAIVSYKMYHLSIWMRLRCFQSIRLFLQRFPGNHLQWEVCHVVRKESNSECVPKVCSLESPGNISPYWSLGFNLILTAYVFALALMHRYTYNRFVYCIVLVKYFNLAQRNEMWCLGKLIIYVKVFTLFWF